MKSKIPKIFFDDEDLTMCVDCMSVDCLCDDKKQVCLCNIDISKCKRPFNTCPCPNCLEVFKKCKCIVTIKKDTKNVD